jgi:hypothetical protein
MRTLARSRTAFLLAAITCGFAACFMTLGLAAATASSCEVTFAGGPDGWTTAATGCAGAVYVQTDAGAVGATYASQADADADWGPGAFVCAAAWTCTGTAASIGTDPAVYDLPRFASTFPTSDAALVASAPSASSASDPLNAADDTIWTQLGGGLHHPIMALGFPLAVVSLAIGLVLKWVRRAVAA